MNQIRVVLLLALALAAPVQANPFLDACGAVLRTIGLTSRSSAFTPDESGILVDWARRHSTDGFQGHNAFTTEQLALALHELPSDLRKRLVVHYPHRAFPFVVSPDIEALFAEYGISHYRVYAIGFLDHYLNFRRWGTPEAAWAELNSELAKVAETSKFERNQMRAEMAVRREVANAIHSLSLTRKAHQIRFEKKVLISPDGRRYEFTARWDGTVRIWVPYKDLIRTQHFLDPAVVSEYRRDDSLGRKGFVGQMSPDGRFILIDQHHRTHAYALNHPGANGDFREALIPVNLSKAQDGRYYSAPHWSVLAYYNLVPNEANYYRWIHDRTWSFLGAEERRALLDAIQKDPVEAIRPYYYESTGLTRPE